ncbi:MAG: 2-succinyl-5-enolpyruvyl-6-hydroxy-3-cyclohexene-1-carboxylic-acid synthase [Oligoflexia bacterium]|nr:2-succinyl-5-enolpyruvyl-6-hydroxy-3-cyclohexene-1-carboxylic-acid synthase [Oligoflexia bacterium]
MSNINLAQKILNTLEKLKVKTICICAGARNSPFVELLSKSDKFEKFNFFDERSAAFFALGRIKSTHNPAAVITTSGTAAGELMPAMMEATYSCLPLIAITADRPKRYRGTGAPQAAEQVGIFGKYAKLCLDIDGLEFDEFNFNLQNPLHFNICFDEPLPGEMPQELTKQAFSYKLQESKFNLSEASEKLKKFFKNHENVFALVGGLNSSESKVVAQFLKNNHLPFYAEAPSQIRNLNELDNIKIFNADKLLQRASMSGFKIDGILRIGDVPTHRLWRDLESLTPLPTLSVSSKPYSGLPGSDLIQVPLESFLPEINLDVKNNFSKFIEQDSQRQKTLDNLLTEEPNSETALIRNISELALSNSRIYLGNSLPIREWDLAARFENKNLNIEATRGLNGIDGQLSYFFGGMKVGQTSWAILGDLTMLYDVQAPWVLNQLEKNDFKIFVINNFGGKIFKNIFNKTPYYNSHSLNFKALAQMWNLSYQVFEPGKMPIAQIVEVIVDEASSSRFWERYKNL